LGRFVALTNKLLWGLNVGVNLNFESFSDLTPDNESTELYIGSQFDMFDFSDWSLKTNINVFPSLSESGRWRVDYYLDIKWDLPLDFYIKTNFQFNYDNRAAVSGSEFDYVWTTGWAGALTKNNLPHLNQESIKKKWLKNVAVSCSLYGSCMDLFTICRLDLNRYQISPYWVDLLLWIFVGIIPSLLVYFHNKERINQRKLRKREKILFPLNIILIMVITYFGFGNSDLGATTKKISYLDEYGIAQSKTITKEEFRIGIPIYGFENKSGNDSISWWRYGIGRLLVYDLEQNKSLSPYSYFYTETSTKITDASIFEDFYVDGDYLVENGQVTINVYIRKANNAKILSKKPLQVMIF
jgi:hypothetical protein